MWIYVPRGSCPSAPEPGNSTSASKWRSQMLASSAALSTKHTPATSWLRAWKMKPWMKPLFGRIYEPSTAALGVASWMASLEVTRASRSAMPESVMEQTTLGISGQRSFDFSVRSGQHGASSKMSEGTLPRDSTSSTETFKTLVIALKQEYSARKRLAQATRERDYSSWPTAVKQDSASSGRHTTETGIMHPGTTLTDAVRTWPTPRTDEHGQMNSQDNGVALSRMAETWPTPRAITGGAESAERKQELGRTESGGGDLQAAAENWPTPGAGDDRGPNPSWAKAAERHAKNGVNKQMGLRDFAVSSPQVRAISVSGGELSPTDLQTFLRRRLNPAFVCWLMGWPWWWTNPVRISFARQAMESYLSRLRTLLASLLVERDSPR